MPPCSTLSSAPVLDLRVQAVGLCGFEQQAGKPVRREWYRRSGRQQVNHVSRTVFLLFDIACLASYGLVFRGYCECYSDGHTGRISNFMDARSLSL